MTPASSKIEPFVWWEGAFTPQELDWLQNEAKNAKQNAYVGDANSMGVHKDIRRSQVSWLRNTQEASWVFRKLSEVGAKLNAQHYNFNLTGFGEELQLANYDQSEHGMYGWHQDFGVGVSRKLSMAVQLTDPSEYEGGNLQVMTGSKPLTVRKQRGLITVFPAYTLHQVTPVTQGSRQSLVAWISGAPFR
jgi:PKHD-type hydroxylase